MWDMAVSAAQKPLLGIAQENKIEETPKACANAVTLQCSSSCGEPQT